MCVESENVGACLSDGAAGSNGVGGAMKLGKRIKEGERGLAKGHGPD